MAEDLIKIGLIGAGGNTRLRHIPGFQEMENVIVDSICAGNGFGSFTTQVYDIL